MTDCIIDTNVLLVASGKCDHVSPDQQLTVIDWLAAFRKDVQRKVVLDPYLKHGIWEEYNHKMTGQDYGLQVIAEKLQSARFVEIEFDAHGHGVLSDDLEKVDPSDRKFVAVALMDISQGGSSLIINAIDSDWEKCKGELHSVGIVVEEILESPSDDKRTITVKSQAKRSNKTKK